MMLVDTAHADCCCWAGALVVGQAGPLIAGSTEVLLSCPKDTGSGAVGVPQGWQGRAWQLGPVPSPQSGSRASRAGWWQPRVHRVSSW